MTESKRAIATDLKALDAHVIRPEEYKDAPEWTAAQIAAADLHEGGKLIRRGRPPSPETRKQPVKIRLDRDVVEKLRATGPGWQTRLNALLREAVLEARPGSAVRIRLRSLAPPTPKWRSAAAKRSKPTAHPKKALKKKARA
jgi:uncharacterized protein (DUF4415 family)